MAAHVHGIGCLSAKGQIVCLWRVVNRVKLRKQKVADRAADLAASGAALFVWPLRNKPETGQIAVTGDASKPGQWRATRFDEHGPVGHEESPTLAGALVRAAEWADILATPKRMR